jgi:hypothetical protein
MLVSSPSVPGITLIKLLTGPYAGIVYSYEYVSVTEEPMLGVAKLSFNYTLYSHTHVSEDPRFRHHAGDVLKEILLSKDANIGNLNGSQSTKASTTGVY